MDPVRALSAVPTSGDYLAFLVYFAFFATLLAVSAIDIDHHIIPNVISRPGIGLGVIATVGLERLGTAATTGTQSVLGAAAGYVVLWGVAELGARVLRREAMGMGDAKLLAMIGAFLGAWPTLVVTVMVAAVVGSVVGVGMQVVRRQPIVGSILPFGPFLVLGAAVWFFGGPELVDTWFRALTPASW